MAQAGETPILDGYTISAKIPQRGPWPEVTFSYRPMVATEAAEFMDNQGRGKERVKRIKERLLKQVTGWDVQKPGTANPEDTVPFNEEWLLKMPLPYLEDMIAAVTGYSTLEQVIDQKN